ncbi:MAG: type II toxin-antitoxin system RelE/ParE family toxin [Chthoniobacter sp.]
MGKFVLAPCIEGELWDIWSFIAKDNPDAATRVVEAIGETFKTVAATPGLGVARKYRNPRLLNVRFFPVSGFENYLVFYRPTFEGIEVLHVYHGARDLDRLFDEN